MKNIIISLLVLFSVSLSAQQVGVSAIFGPPSAKELIYDIDKAVYEGRTSDAIYTIINYFYFTDTKMDESEEIILKALKKTASKEELKKIFTTPPMPPLTKGMDNVVDKIRHDIVLGKGDIDKLIEYTKYLIDDGYAYIPVVILIFLEENCTMDHEQKVKWKNLWTSKPASEE